jgi:hypothetical protein
VGDIKEGGKEEKGKKKGKDMRVKEKEEAKMSYFNKKRFTMRQVIGLLTIVFLGITAIAYAAVSFTDFTTGSTISSSEMNAKLNALKNAVNNASLTAQGIQGDLIVSIPSDTAVEIVGVDFTCPADGFVIAHGHLIIDLNHTTGISDNMYIKVAKTIDASFPGDGWTQAFVPSSYPTTAQTRIPVYVSARFSCIGGIAERYRINGAAMMGADASDEARWATIIVQYSPN